MECMTCVLVVGSAVELCTYWCMQEHVYAVKIDYSLEGCNTCARCFFHVHANHNGKQCLSNVAAVAGLYCLIKRCRQTVTIAHASRLSRPMHFCI